VTNWPAILARAGCDVCAGSGYVLEQICDCVCLRVFDESFSRYQFCVERQEARQTAPVEEGITCHRPAEEYICDFELIARKALSQVKLTAAPRRLGSAPKFMKVRVGRLLLEVKPFSVYPPEYFDR
jgi:hypothetical protein